MWTFTLRIPEKEPLSYVLKSGRNTIGRKLDNDVVIEDSSASRLHAVAYYDEVKDLVTLNDVGSTNGTFVNRERISGTKYLEHDDVIRIGGLTIDVSHRAANMVQKDISGSHRFTRELLLESLDHHAVLMYEVAYQLNTVLDIDTALNEVSNLMRMAMGADRCEVLLAESFDQIGELGFPSSIAKSAIEGRSAVVIPDLTSSKIGQASKSANLLRIKSLLCVPVMDKDEVIALIYMHKTGPNPRPFDQRDLQLAVAISHQASLTIQRMRLIDAVRAEQRGRLLLQRFLSPQEAEYMLPNYLESGQLPGLTERVVSILFVDIMGSTSLSEQLGAQGFGEVLNRFYWDATDVIFEQRGLVKYAGDGVLAVFGMSQDADGHELRAVKAGSAILQHITSAEFGTGVRINVGVGVNTGEAMIGYVGTQQRVELTALGYVVNIAHELQSLARPNRLMIGPVTAQRVKGEFPLRDLGKIELRGSKEPYQAFEVLLNDPSKNDEVINL